MRVARSLQGKGYGTQLLRRLEWCARERGVQSLVLQTAAARPLTLEFYREIGSSFYGQVETIRFAKNLDDAQAALS